jgi:hypothetical protein
MILFKVLIKKFVKDGASQFQNVRVNFHKFHALFPTRLSQLGKATASCAQDGFRKCSRVRTKRREWLRLTFFKRYHKDGDESLNHIVRVMSVEPWLLFVNTESKGQSKK